MVGGFCVGAPRPVSNVHASVALISVVHRSMGIVHWAPGSSGNTRRVTSPFGGFSWSNLVMLVAFALMPQVVAGKAKR